MLAKVILLLLVTGVICKSLSHQVFDLQAAETTAVAQLRSFKRSLASDYYRIFIDLLGIRNYACKKYFVCRIGQFFSSSVTFKDRLMRILLEFPLAAIIVADDTFNGADIAETLATAVNGFTNNACNIELYELCKGYQGKRSNFTETHTGRFLRQLLLDQEISNKLDLELLAQAQQELSAGFWNLVNSYMIPPVHFTSPEDQSHDPNNHQTQ